MFSLSHAHRLEDAPDEEFGIPGIDDLEDINDEGCDRLLQERAEREIDEDYRLVGDLQRAVASISKSSTFDQSDLIALLKRAERRIQKCLPMVVHRQAA